MATKSEKILTKCNQMCPPSECIKREKDNLIHILETDNLNVRRKNRKANPAKMVKSYSRSAAGQTLTCPDLLRSPSVLLNTVHYLLEKVIKDDRVSKTTVYDFINDRLRSVKQDGIVQRMCSVDWFKLLPPIIRFYSYSAYWFCEEPAEHFDQKLNTDQLIDSLLLYITNYEQNADPKYAADYAEVETLYLIVKVDSQTINRAVFLNLTDNVFQNTLKLILKWYTKNYIAVFRLLSKIPVLPACLFIALHISQVRKEFLLVISHAYSSKNVHYPVELLKTNLLFNSTEEVVILCKSCGIAIDHENNTVDFEKSLFQNYKALYKKIKKVDEKLGSSITTLLLQNRRKNS